MPGQTNFDLSDNLDLSAEEWGNEKINNSNKKDHLTESMEEQIEVEK